MSARGQQTRPHLYGETDLSQPTHGLVEKDALGVILFQRLKASHLRPKYGVLNGRYYALL